MILKYLEENGYKHTAFNFLKENHSESLIKESLKIPPGLLVSLIQRGVIYSDIECEISKNFEFQIGILSALG